MERIVDKLKCLESRDKSYILDYLKKCRAIEEQAYIIENYLSQEEILEYILDRLKDDNLDAIIFAPYLKDDRAIENILKCLVNPTTTNDILTRVIRSKTATNSDFSYLLSLIQSDFIFLHNALTYQNHLTGTIFKRLCTISDEEKLAFLDLADDRLKLMLILSLKNQNLLEKHMNHLDKQNCIAIALNLKNDKLTLKLLPFIKDNRKRYELSCTLKSDDNLVKSLNYLYTSGDILNIIQRIENPDLILELFELYFLSDEQKFKTIYRKKDPKVRTKLAEKCFPILGKEIYENTYDKHFEIPEYLDALPADLFFGVELECIGPASRGILLSQETILNKFSVRMEGTLRDGMEFTSHKFSWTKENLESIYQICDFATLNRLTIDSRCGGHIHYSSDYLDSYDAWFWFYYLYSKFEFILYLISNEPNTLPRSNIDDYAKPLSKKYTENLWELETVKSKEEFIRTIKTLTGKKESGVNLSNIFEKFNTIEIRIPNGSLNPETILENVLLFGNLMKVAKELAKLSLTESLQILLYELDDETLSDDKKLEILLKLLFKDENLKSKFRNKYIANKRIYDNTKNSLKIEKDMKSFSFQKLGIHI